MKRLIAIVAEHFEGRVTPVTYEAIACALEIEHINPSRVVTLAVGGDADDICREVLAVSGSPVYAVKVPGLTSYNSDAYRTVLAAVFAELKPSWVCVPGTTQGFDFAPGLAVRMRGVCIGGVQQIVEKGGCPAFVRTLFNGKIAATVGVQKEPTVLIVQPGFFRATFTRARDQGLLESTTIQWKPARTRSLGFKTAETSDSPLGEASVIVSAGRGTGRKENLELLRRVASLFSRSAVAGSRPLCDLGWLPYRLQVGQTGATVTPDLYLACGISGSQQHLAGMRGSKFIVAVNTDPNAAIFNEADIGIVEDLEGFFSDFLDEYRGWANSDER